MLRRNSIPVQFSILQKLLEDDKVDVSPATIQHLPDDVVKDLSTIARYVVSCSGEGRTDILTAYAQIRSTTLGRSLSAFTESTSLRSKQVFTSCKYTT